MSECGVLATPFSTYQLTNDIAVRDTSYGYVCFDILYNKEMFTSVGVVRVRGYSNKNLIDEDITGHGITLDGNGFELSSASEKMLHATGVQYLQLLFHLHS